MCNSKEITNEEKATKKDIALLIGFIAMTVVSGLLLLQSPFIMMHILFG